MKKQIKRTSINLLCLRLALIRSFDGDRYDKHIFRNVFSNIDFSCQ